MSAVLVLAVPVLTVLAGLAAEVLADGLATIALLLAVAIVMVFIANFPCSFTCRRMWRYRRGSWSVGGLGGSGNGELLIQQAVGGCHGRGCCGSKCFDGGGELSVSAVVGDGGGGVCGELHVNCTCQQRVGRLAASYFCSAALQYVNTNSRSMVSSVAVSDNTTVSVFAALAAEVLMLSARVMALLSGGSCHCRGGGVCNSGGWLQYLRLNCLRLRRFRYHAAVAAYGGCDCCGGFDCCNGCCIRWLVVRLW